MLTAFIVRAWPGSGSFYVRTGESGGAVIDWKLEKLAEGVGIYISREHRFGTDAFLLADFAAPRRRDLACDLGQAAASYRCCGSAERGRRQPMGWRYSPRQSLRWSRRWSGAVWPAG